VREKGDGVAVAWDVGAVVGVVSSGARVAHPVMNRNIRLDEKRITLRVIL
jgi:hypothetical protein